eukprot:COSAG05_NODE_33_length_28089_cov_31.909289_3_plen_91_part_00
MRVIQPTRVLSSMVSVRSPIEMVAGPLTAVIAPLNQKDGAQPHSSTYCTLYRLYRCTTVLVVIFEYKHIEIQLRWLLVSIQWNTAVKRDH